MKARLACVSFIMTLLLGATLCVAQTTPAPAFRLIQSQTGALIGPSVSDPSGFRLHQSHSGSILREKSVDATSQTAIYHGLGEAPSVYNFGAIQPFSRGFIPFSPQDNGLLTQRLEVRALINGLEQSLGEATREADGWYFLWSSREPVPDHARVQLKVRAYDGLTWGAWKESTGFVVDNQGPRFIGVTANMTGLAPNSELAQLDMTWVATDNLQNIQISVFALSEHNLQKLDLTTIRFWFDADDAGYMTVDTAGKVSELEDKGLLNKRYVQPEGIHQPTRVFDSRLNKHLLRFRDNQFLSGNITELVGESFVAYSVYKPRSHLGKQSLFHIKGSRQFVFGTEHLSRLLTDRSGAIDAVVPLEHEQLILHITTYDHTTGQLETYLNGVQVMSRTVRTGQLDGRFIMGHEPSNLAFNGDLGELILIKNETDIDPSIENYLALKWGYRSTSPASITSGISIWIDQAQQAGASTRFWADRGGQNHQLMTKRLDLDGRYYRFNPRVTSTSITLTGNRSVAVLDSTLEDTSTTIMVYKITDPSTRDGELIRLHATENHFISLSMDAGQTRQVKLQKVLGSSSTGINRFNIRQQDLSILVLVDDGENLKIYQDGALLSSMASLASRGQNWKKVEFGAGLHIAMNEIIVYNKALTRTEQDKVEKFLIAKWAHQSRTDDWSLRSSGVDLRSISTREQDNSYYLYKIVAKDLAGNAAEFFTSSLYAPDRTAPRMNSGLVGATDLDAVRGVEDQDVRFNLMNTQSDNVDSGDNLQWSVELYMSDGLRSNPLVNPSFAADSVIRRATIRDGQLMLIVSPNANTDSPALGNRFGKENAYMRLTLTDREGNSVSNDIQIIIEGVNDAPFFTRDVLGSIFLRDGDTQQIVYNIKWNEDSTASITLDDFVDDVDNDFASLEFSVSSGNFFQVGSRPFNSQLDAVFESLYMTAQIGNQASNHELTLISTPNWYGDARFDLMVSDGLLATSNPFVARVWPVNDAPLISSDMPVYRQINEDSAVTFNLHTFEDDIILEDVVPTFHNQLNWTVVTSDAQFVSSISGENSFSDTLIFNPVANAFGTTTVVLQLRDTDEVPQQVFGIHERYIPNPKTTTKAVTVEWLPVNDPPVIGDISPITTTEDAAATVVDLSSFKSDVEDSVSDLTWGVVSSPVGLVSVDLSGDTLTVTPIAQAWGSGTIVLSLTDQDTGVIEHGYFADPKTTTKAITVTVSAVNDVPSLTGVALSGLTSTSRTLVRSTDILSIVAEGYRDVGYASGAIVSEVGDEYGVPNNPALNFLTNSPKHSFTITVRSGSSVLQTETHSQISTSSVQFTLEESMEGKTIHVSAVPFDNIESGNTVTSSITVNQRPPAISSTTATPQGDFWTDTSNITLGWGQVADPDGDPVGYRLAIWKVPQWNSPPPDTVAVAPYFDTDFSTTLTSNYVSSNIADGHYYWTVYAGNNIESDIWDYRDSGWLHTFHIDTQAPVISTEDARVFTNTILQNPTSPLELANNSRTLYGTKPAIEGEGLLYSVHIFATNTDDVGVITTSSVELISTTNADEWTSRITFPSGTTEYRVTLRDMVGNETEYLAFTVVDDVTPPPPPDIDATPGLSVADGVYSALTSQNYFSIFGEKEIYSSIDFNGINILGHSPTTNFNIRIYPLSPSGVLTAVDRSDNRSTGVTVNITFLIGPPIIPTFSVSRTLINSPENTAIQHLSSTTLNAITRASVEWTSNRAVSRYAIINASGNRTVLSGSSIASDTLVTDVIVGNNAALDEGVNDLYLEVADLANNVATQAITLTLQTEPPTTAFITDGNLEFFNSRWIVEFNGNLISGLTHNIVIREDSGSVTQSIDVFSNGTWRYFNPDFDPANKDIDIVVQDNVFNTSTRTLWNSASFDDGSTRVAIQSTDTSIILPYSSLPSTIIGLYDIQLSEHTVGVQSGLSVLSQQQALEFDTADERVRIHKGLEDTVYDIYAKDMSNNVISDLDLSDHNIRVRLSFANADVESDVIVPLVFDNDTRKWVEFTGPYEINHDDRTLTMSLASTGKIAAGDSSPFQDNLGAMRVYPNPWVPEDGIDSNGTLASGIVFDQLSEGVRVRIYTISGQLVQDARPAAASWRWDGNNRHGQAVASGVYIYLVTDGNDQKRGKLTVIR